MDDDPSEAKWTHRANEWERRKKEMMADLRIGELRAFTSGGSRTTHPRNMPTAVPTAARPTAVPVPVPVLNQQPLYVGQSVNDELDRALQRKMTELESALKSIVEEEWRVKLPEIEYGLKEKHTELKELFDRNTRTALNIGSKVLEVGSSVDSLKNDQREVAAWKRDVDKTLRDHGDDIAAQQAKGSEVVRERQNLAAKIKDVEILADAYRLAEVRTDARMQEELRTADKRNEQRIADLHSKLTSTTRCLEEESEAARLQSRRITDLQAALESSAKDVSKVKSKLHKTLSELDGQAEDIEEIRDKLKTMAQSTHAGYCQGCRLVMQDLESKLFAVKQSICFLDDEVKRAKDELKRQQEDQADRATHAPLSSLPQDALLQQQQQLQQLSRQRSASSERDVTGPRVGDLEKRVLSLEGTVAAFDARGVSEAVTSYVDNAIERVIREHISDLWEEVKNRQLEADAFREQMTSFDQRLNDLY
ncbi:hypothetical protein DIPPA_31922 [Diplonema papillatum]|nr:hypothetical protein DIPPA_31922 [Diplonema papillatum]